MAKLGLQFLVLLSLGLLYFPDPSRGQYELSHGSCLGVERISTHGNNRYGAYRRTIGSGLFYKSNPDMWILYDRAPDHGDGPGGRWYYLVSGYEEPMQLELYWIKVDGRFLNGWLHVVVKTTGPSARDFGILQIHGIVDWGNIENAEYTNSGYGGFGEFVHDFPSCTDDEHKGDVKPNQYQYMPCGGVPLKFQTTPWGFEYVEPQNGTEFNYLVPSEKQREFHMNFRFSTQPCSHPTSLRFAVIGYFPTGTVGGGGGSDYRWRYGATDEFQLTPDHVVGASDPVPRSGTYTTLDCSTRISNSATPKFVKPNTVNRIKSHRYFSWGCSEAGTRTFYFDGIPHEDYQGETNLFGGRCVDNGDREEEHLDRDRASRTRINVCHPRNTEIKDPSTGKTAVAYDNHIGTITGNITRLCAPCPTVPPRPVTTGRTRPTARASSSTSPRPSGAPKDNFMTEDLVDRRRGVEMIGRQALEIWDTRVLHGVCMTILSIFVSPINIFITRYFKETFMDTRILFLRLWYFVHHSAIVASAILYGAGHWRIVSRRILAGVSLDTSATVHRSLGWASIGIVILLGLFGGFRPIARKLRTYVIAAHWTVGMMIYFMNYALMIISVWIPASPSASADISLVDDSFKIEKQVLPYLVILWILFDVVMHVLMTNHVCSMDKRLGLTRPRYWLPVPISVLPENETRDLIGSSYRKKMLAIYGVVALLFTVAISCVLLTSNPNGRGLGYMSCTHYGHAEYWQELAKKRC